MSKEKAISKAIFDFLEVMGYLNQMFERNIYPSHKGRELNNDWRAYSTAAIICYSRPFLKSYGLPSLREEFLSQMSGDDKEAHEEFLMKRNQLVAHGDGGKFEIQVKNAERTAMSLHSDDKYLTESAAEKLNDLAEKMLKIAQRMRSSD